jgi:hypothetical protein
MEGSGTGIIDILSWHFSGRLRKLQQISDRIAIILAKIQAKHPLNTGLEEYCYTNLHGVMVLYLYKCEFSNKKCKI